MKPETTELATIPSETAMAVFSTDNGLDPYIERVRSEVLSVVPDVSTKKGRDAIASAAYKVSQSKTYLDKTGKELVDSLKEIPKKIDAERKRMRDALDALRDQVRKPLTDWEEAEEARVNNHKHKISVIELRNECSDLDAIEIQQNIEWLMAMNIGPDFEEFELSATKAKEKALESLNAALVKRKAYDAEQAELARLREEAAQREQKEREERIAREAAEAARLQAEREAQEERDRIAREAQAERDAAAKREADAKAESDRRELELIAQAENAKREAAEAELRAERAAQAERDRIAAEKAAAEKEAILREKDIAHKKEANNQAVADFVKGGMTEECAKQAVTLIAKKTIRRVSIAY